MIDDVNLFATQLVTLWVVLEPLSHLSLFLSATDHVDAAARRKVAALALSFAYLILVAFALAGRWVLEAMGISILAFQIAGGLILFLFALSMVFGEGGRSHALEVGPERSLAALAVYPVAIPILAGPGAILAVVLFSDNNRGSFANHAVTLSVLALMMLVLFTVFWLGDYILRVVGQSGTNLLRRVMGILLAAFSVNLVLNAFQKWLGLPQI